MKKSYLAIGLVFVASLAGLSLASLLTPDREFSENENRYLAKAPVFSVKNVMNGNFQEDLESYLNDQIWNRNLWITTKTAIQKASRDTDIGGAYLGKDGYDFEKILPEDIDDKLVQRNIKSVKTYFDGMAEEIGKEHLSFVLVPTSGLVLRDELPANAILFDQEVYINRVQEMMKGYTFVNPQVTLESHAKEQMYYRTDHHWTTAGAFCASQDWCAAVGNTVPSIDDYNTKTVTDKFRGSLYSKVLDFDSAYDTIECMERKNAQAYHVIADGEELDGFYQDEKLTTKDKYAYFFGGNYGEVIITNPQMANETRNLLVIKDSFANSFVPLIADQYSHIYMVDLRYYAGNMKTYAQEHDVTDILVLYNISNFVTDKNVFKLNGRS